MKKLVAAGVAAFLAGAGLVVVIVGVVAGGVAAEIAAQQSPACTVPPGVTLTAATLTKTQLAVAAEIVTVGATIPHVGQVGQVVAVATALDESDLRNLGYGTGQSHGVFQQQAPGFGWGTVAETENVAVAARMFYTRLVTVPGWSTATTTSSPAVLGGFAQAVQHSAIADGSNYAAQIPLAARLVGSATPDGAGRCTTLVSVTVPASAKLTPADVARIRRAPLTVQVAIAYALDQLGKPYLWGRTGPAAFDCSGLTMEAYAAAGIVIPRTSQIQATAGTPVAPADVQPGDLVFPFADESHVMLALGGGLAVEAPHTGATVRITVIYGDAGGIRRIVPHTLAA